MRCIFQCHTALSELRTDQIGFIPQLFDAKTIPDSDKMFNDSFRRQLRFYAIA
jgi:hypothetical protein